MRHLFYKKNIIKKCHCHWNRSGLLRKKCLWWQWQKKQRKQWQKKQQKQWQKNNRSSDRRNNRNSGCDRTQTSSKKRGRPKAAAKQVAKAAAPKRAVRMKPPSPASSTRSDDNDETPLNRDDMETLLLDYLVKRKQSQQSARRAMWSQLAGLS